MSSHSTAHMKKQKQNEMSEVGTTDPFFCTHVCQLSKLALAIAIFFFLPGPMCAQSLVPFYSCLYGQKCDSTQTISMTTTNITDGDNRNLAVIATQALKLLLVLLFPRHM